MALRKPGSGCEDQPRHGSLCDLEQRTQPLEASIYEDHIDITCVKTRTKHTVSSQELLAVVATNIAIIDMICTARRLHNQVRNFTLSRVNRAPFGSTWALRARGGGGGNPSHLTVTGDVTGGSLNSGIF